MTTIVLATDGSKSSLRAEDFVSTSYDPSNDDVLIVSVAYVPEFVAQYASDDPGSGMTVEDIEKRFINQAEAYTQDALERFRAQGFNVKTSVRVGHPGVEICSVASDNQANCIVMGRRGQTSSSDPLVGSVSQYVLHNAPCPVNVVPL